MDEKTNITDNLLVRKRLGGLRLRLNSVTRAWTVDSYESLLKFYVSILPKVMEAERCTIYIIEMGTDRICSMFGTGLEGKKIEPPREGSIAGKVISSGKGLIENDLDKRSGYHTLVAEETGFITRNMVCVPIKSATTHGVTGAVQVLNKINAPSFDDQDLVMLEEVAGYLSMSIESIIINQEILRISNQLNREVESFDQGRFFDMPFIAESSAMRDILDLVRLVSTTPVNILLQGENGTGKELVARMIHEASERRNQPFIAVNCASIPENLMESEFFGYEKGAFTGADRSRKGRFEDANGGTLMLDEIADMPLAIQPKFLRAIQEGEGYRLGSNKLIKYDLRIISASNKDLKTELEQNRFREDLFFRLFSVEIRIPPLRERKTDIIPMAIAFLEEVSKRFNKRVAGFSPVVLNIFEDFAWPGNVRQLHSEIERLVALTPEGKYILPDKCSRELIGASSLSASSDNLPGITLPEQIKDLEIRLIEKALKASRGNRVRAAGLLGITRQGLHKKIKRYQINVASHNSTT